MKDPLARRKITRRLLLALVVATGASLLVPEEWTFALIHSWRKVAIFALGVLIGRWLLLSPRLCVPTLWVALLAALALLFFGDAAALEGLRNLSIPLLLMAVAIAVSIFFSRQKPAQPNESRFLFRAASMALTPLVIASLIAGEELAVVFGSTTAVTSICCLANVILLILFRRDPSAPKETRPIRGIIALLLLLIVGAWLWTFSSPPRVPLPTDGTARPLARIGLSNLLWHNPNPLSALMAFGEEEGLDVLAVNEVGPKLQRLFGSSEAVLARWPHRVTWPPLEEDWDSETWGLALLSRHPIKASKAHLLGQDPKRALGVLEVTLDLSGTEVLVYVTHAPRPRLNLAHNRARRAFFESLSEVIGANRWPNGNVLLLGDLNANQGSPWLKNFLRKTGLRDSRHGFGIQASWPSPLAVTGLGLALDHALVGRDFAVLDRKTRFVAGSDHRGVVIAIGRAEP